MEMRIVYGRSVGRLARLAVLIAATLAPVAGCGGPEVSRDELGEVVFDVPEVEGADQSIPSGLLDPPTHQGPQSITTETETPP